MTIYTGVISSNNVAWEFVDNEICMICDKHYENYDKDICPECNLESLEYSSEFDGNKICRECGYEFSIDDMECFDHEKLIGDWKKDEDGLYEPDENGEFAAIVTDSTFNCVQVVWSKYIMKNKRFCSPCFPNQADADSSDGNLVCYSLPDYMISIEECETYKVYDAKDEE